MLYFCRGFGVIPWCERPNVKQSVCMHRGRMYEATVNHPQSRFYTWDRCVEAFM